MDSRKSKVFVLVLRMHVNKLMAMVTIMNN
jgi:hypothetical protein